MILSASRRPDRSHLSKTGSNSEIASNTKEKAIEKRRRASRRQDNRQRARKGNPSTGMVNSLQTSCSKENALLENRKGHASHCQLGELLLEMAFGRCGLPTERFHIVLLGLVRFHVRGYDYFI